MEHVEEAAVGFHDCRVVFHPVPLCDEAVHGSGQLHDRDGIGQRTSEHIRHPVTHESAAMDSHGINPLMVGIGAGYPELPRRVCEDDYRKGKRDRKPDYVYRNLPFVSPQKP